MAANCCSASKADFQDTTTLRSLGARVSNPQSGLSSAPIECYEEVMTNYRLSLLFIALATAGCDGVSGYRPQYQEAYEEHINWEFTEEELLGIVSFLESPLGKHYLDGSWRMRAYTGTTMEETEEMIVRQAVQLHKAR